MGNLANSGNIRAMKDSIEFYQKLQEEAAMNPDSQDIRIGALKRELRTLMGQEAFVKFYVKTSMNGDLLEKQLREQLDQFAMVVPELVSVSCHQDTGL
jgi:hypothetical protein